LIDVGIVLFCQPAKLCNAIADVAPKFGIRITPGNKNLLIRATGNKSGSHFNQMLQDNSGVQTDYFHKLDFINH